LFLARQFERLAEHDIGVFWAGGRADPLAYWPSGVELPDRVFRFPAGSVEAHVAQRDGVAVARLLGASRDPQRKLRPSDFAVPDDELPAVAVVYGRGGASLAGRGVDYWALGGLHQPQAAGDGSVAAHYPGSPQGRSPSEPGAHGGLLVEIDQRRSVHVEPVACEVMHWVEQRVLVEPSTTRADLETLLRQRMLNLAQANPGLDLLVEWTVAGSGPILGDLRQGPLAAELLAGLRNQFGFGPPAAWSLALQADVSSLSEAIPAAWHQEETIRGDYLQAVRRLEADPAAPLGLEAYLPDTPLGQRLGRRAVAPGGHPRGGLLREAAVLGVELLSGEGDPS
jgi:hypothetical protein